MQGLTYMRTHTKTLNPFSHNHSLIHTHTHRECVALFQWKYGAVMLYFTLLQ